MSVTGLASGAPLLPPRPGPQRSRLASLASLAVGVSSQAFVLSAGRPAASTSDARRTALSKAPFAAVIPGDSAAEAVLTVGIYNFLNIYNALLIGRLILTWFPSPVLLTPLATLCDPYLNLFRGLIPPIGGTLDLSPILAFLLLNSLTSAAAALPAEMPGAAADAGDIRARVAARRAAAAAGGK